MPSRPGVLARYLALAYVLLVVYASLHPFAGWRDLGVSPLAFLEAGWPRYWTVFDLAVNVGVYLPLGFLLALALPTPWLPRLLPSLLAALLGGGLSFCLEAVQTWLPSRVPSNLDLACNALGALLGAVVAFFHGGRLFQRLTHWQGRLVAELPHAEAGAVLLGLWLVTQLTPETLLFGNGDLRSLLGLPLGVPFAPPLFQLVESLIVAASVLAVGLFARTLLAAPGPAWLGPPLLIAAALGIKALALAVLVSPGDAFAWWSEGARQGLLWGVLALAALAWLPPNWRIVLAGMALMAATVLVNLAPENPYSTAALAVWRQGHFFNFNGLTRLTAALWPFAALPYLMLLGRRL